DRTAIRLACSGIDLVCLLRSIFPLRSVPAALLVIRRNEHAVRWTIHDGRCLYTVQKRTRPGRCAVRFLPSSPASRPGPDTVYPVFPAWRHRHVLGWLLLRSRILGHPGTLQHHSRWPPYLSV